jgi:hypothetical protein
MRLHRVSSMVVLSCLTVVSQAAQTHVDDTDKTKAKLTEAAKEGLPLNTDLTVRGNVTLQAVLIPTHVARRVFGKEVADNYAVIELNINNKSSDASLLIQGVYLDYTDWALSGSIQPDAVCTETSDESGGGTYRACTKPNQVASEEYRVIRGESLDAQPFTVRNLIVGGLALGGSIVSAYSFSIKEKGILQGIAAFSGAVVPGLKSYWPDQTVDQINRISDFGYHTNKAIPKQGSDIVVCFFPIDRFLTPGFKKIFLKEPALFLSPYEMLLDPKSLDWIFSPHGGYKLRVDPKDMLGAMGIDNPKELGKALPCYLEYRRQLVKDKALARASGRNGLPDKAEMKDESTSTSWAENLRREAYSKDGCSNDLSSDQIRQLDTIGRVSLNTIRVVLDGVMSVETAALPAKIESVDFDNEKTNTTLWTDTATILTGTINGAYLTGGVPKIQEDVGTITAVTEGSTDQALKFKLKLKDKIDEGKQLTFIVEKTTKDASGATNTIDSTPFLYKVKFAHGVPKIDSIVFEGEDTNPTLWSTTGTKKGTIHGSNLTSATPQIDNAGSLGISDLKADTLHATDLFLPFSFNLGQARQKGDKLTFTVRKGEIEAQGGKTTLTSASKEYDVDTDPVISKVEAKDKTVTVTGGRFFNDKSQLSVSLTPTEGAKTAVAGLTVPSPTEVEFGSPAPGCWTAEVKVGSASATSRSFPVIPQPQITSATMETKSSTITVTGSGFTDTSSCGGAALTFQLVSDKSGAKPAQAGKLAGSSATKVILGLPAEAKSGTWKVQALLGKEVKASVDLK